MAYKCTRTHCQVGRKKLTIARLLGDYRCAECEGRLDTIAIVADYVIVGYQVKCNTCDTFPDKLISCHQIREQLVEGVDVYADLPPAYRDIIKAQNAPSRTEINLYLHREDRNGTER